MNTDLEKFSIQNLETLCDNEENIDKRIECFSLLAKKCPKNDHYLDFFKQHLVSDEDIDVKRKIIDIFFKHFCLLCNQLP